MDIIKKTEEIYEDYDVETMQFLQSVWYILAEKIFNDVVEITQLDEERATALRNAVLRPNDFEIKIK
jgi:hypothetical protein